MGKGAVQEYFIEYHTFILKGFKNEIMNGPEGLFREGIGSQAILIGNHDQFIIQLLGYFSQIGKRLWIENHFFKGIYLLVYRFLNNGTVPIDK